MKHPIYLFFLFFLCNTSVAFSAQEVKLGCKQLRLVLDSRLNPKLVEEEWGSGNTRAEEPAILELINCKGELVDQLVLQSPLAQLDPLPIRGAPNPTYLVSADLTAEMGSYNGPVTIPIQVVNNHLIESVAQYSDKHIEPIHLTITLKSAWKRVSNRNIDDLFQVSCKPKEDKSFVTYYRHYFLSHNNWQVKIRSREGLWESDGEFPNRNSFP